MGFHGGARRWSRNSARGFTFCAVAPPCSFVGTFKEMIDSFIHFPSFLLAAAFSAWFGRFGSVRFGSVPFSFFNPIIYCWVSYLGD